MRRVKCLRSFFLVLFLMNIAEVSAQELNKIYLIGDSLSDQGNLFLAIEAELGTGVPANDHYFEGRFSDGLNFVDVLAEKLSVESTPSFSGGNNFAYGGARIDYNRVEDDTTKPFPFSFLGHQGSLPEDQFPWTLEGQRAAFASREIDDSKALYIVFFGSNDLGDLAAAVAFIAPQTGIDIDFFINSVTAKVVQGISDSIEAFVDSGAQDIIVPNLPNLGVVPNVTFSGPEFAALATQLSAQYNVALSEMLKDWEGVVNIIPFDTFSFLTEVVSAPASFGFSNASEGCYTGFVDPAGPSDTVCDDPSAYVFWDGEHPTEPFHTLLANHILMAAANDVLDDLIDRVGSIDAHRGIRRSLGAKLSAAQRRINRPKNNNHKAASRLLVAFLKSVEALADRKITLNDSAILIERGEKVLVLLGGI